MAEPIEVFEQLVNNIKDTISLIDQGLEAQDFDSSQGAELEDITDELKNLLRTGKEDYDDFLDFGQGDPTRPGKLVAIFESNSERVDELNARVRQLMGPQEV